LPPVASRLLPYAIAIAAGRLVVTLGIRPMQRRANQPADRLRLALRAGSASLTTSIRALHADAKLAA